MQVAAVTPAHRKRSGEHGRQADIHEMKCINCGLINPETALRCDCGYDFATQSMMASYVPGYESPVCTEYSIRQ